MALVLQNYRTTNYRTTELQNNRTTEQQNDRTTERKKTTEICVDLLFCRSIVLSFYRSVVLSFCRSVVPSAHRSNHLHRPTQAYPHPGVKRKQNILSPMKKLQMDAMANLPKRLAKIDDRIPHVTSSHRS
jgi:hypothetical protein